jgi:hypothetical protein
MDWRAQESPPPTAGFRWRVAVLLGVSVAVAVGLAVQPPLPQRQSYHHFADQRHLLGVPNLCDVASNLPFLLVGVAGLLLVRRGPEAGGPCLDAQLRGAWLAFFAGVGLTCFGSAYYHLAPDNGRLFWDRLPMTVAFMSLFAAVLGERLGPGVGAALLVPLLAAGAYSVLYWRLTDDLRLYYYVQFYPMLALPLVLLLFPARYTGTADLIAALGWYVLAKVLEEADARIFDATGQAVSGHTLKHLAAATGAYWILRMLRRRRRAATNKYA